VFSKEASEQVFPSQFFIRFKSLAWRERGASHELRYYSCARRKKELKCGNEMAERLEKSCDCLTARWPQITFRRLVLLCSFAGHRAGAQIESFRVKSFEQFPSIQAILPAGNQTEKNSSDDVTISFCLPLLSVSIRACAKQDIVS
jgi:hypothetical protein